MKKNSCIVCNGVQVDKCHIKTKGSGGGLDEDNIFYACRLHHVEQHRIGIVTFVEKYSEVKKAFENKGWEVVLEFNQKKLRRKK